MQNEAETPRKSQPSVQRTDHRLDQWLRWIPLRAFLWIALTGAFLSLFRSTLGQATDFQVFWKVGQALRQHLPFYDVTQDAGMVFKYPPWIAILFYPLGWIDFVTGKGVWALLELLSLLSIIWSLRRDFRVSELAIIVLFPLYWGIWVIHFLDGQIMLPILAVYLFFLSNPKADASARGILPILMSAKVFTLFPLFAIADKFKSKRAIFATLMLGIAFTGGTALLSFEGNIPLTLQKWTEAAASGGKTLSPGQTRGSKNQSVVSYLCRTANVPIEAAGTEVAISLLFYLFAFAFLNWRRTEVAQGKFGTITKTDLAFIFLALTPPFHPLPWHHLYTWTFPLAVYRFDRDKKRPFYWVAIALIGFSSARAIPLGDIGEFLEWNVGRAWGAILLVAQALFIKSPIKRPESGGNSPAEIEHV